MYQVKVSTQEKIPIRLMLSSDPNTPATGVAEPAVYYTSNGSAASQFNGAMVWTELSSQYFPGVYMIDPIGPGWSQTPGPLVLSVNPGVSGTFSQAVILIDVVQRTEDESLSLVSGLPFQVWDSPVSGAYSATSFGRRIELSKKLFTNKTVITSSGMTVYDDNNSTVLGTFTWNSGTGTKNAMT